MRKKQVKRLRRILALAFVESKADFKHFKTCFRRLKKDYTRGLVNV